MLASDYPFTSGAGDDSADCLYSASKATSVEVSGYSEFIVTRRTNVMKILKVVVARQPVSTAIAVNSIYIHSYASGVVDAWDCYVFHDDINPINHAVLVVGYGTDEATGLDYWLLKNSWNTTWGDKGYFKLVITDRYGGICGMYTHPIYPKLK